MKIVVKKKFKYQKDARTTREVRAGLHEVGKDISKEWCEFALSHALAYVYVEPVVKPVFKKVAPENKVVEASTNKSKVAKKSGSRRSTRPKSNK